MVRPRESFDHVCYRPPLSIMPEPSRAALAARCVRERGSDRQVFGRTRELRIESAIASVQHAPLGAEDVNVERYARRFPFTYASEDMPDLLARSSAATTTQSG